MHSNIKSDIWHNLKAAKNFIKEDPVGHDLSARVDNVISERLAKIDIDVTADIEFFIPWPECR